MDLYIYLFSTMISWLVSYAVSSASSSFTVFLKLFVSNLYPVYCFRFIWAVERVSTMFCKHYCCSEYSQHEATSLCPMSSFFSPNLIIHISLGEIPTVANCNWCVFSGHFSLHGCWGTVWDEEGMEILSHHHWVSLMIHFSHRDHTLMLIHLKLWCSFPWKFTSLKIILFLLLCLNHKVYFPDHNSYCILKIHNDSSNSQLCSAIIPAFLGFP